MDDVNGVFDKAELNTRNVSGFSGCLDHFTKDMLLGS